ncbi:MAG: hypothetical protein HYY85_14950 [Deltaproteobacteria bacterium]|nr:hypothetical protein [Deltaproteobacteria bacterium]
MKKKVLLVVGLLLALGASAWAQTLERVDRVSNSGFDKTVRQLEVAIKGKGMMVVAVIDHQNLMRMGEARPWSSAKPRWGR